MVQHFDTLTPAKYTKCWSIKDLLYRLIFYDHFNRWSGFEECVEGLQKWLKEAEASLPTEPELKATLDEKRAQLQVYRCDSKPLPTYNTVVCSSNQHRAVTFSKEAMCCHGNRLSINNKTNNTFVEMNIDQSSKRGINLHSIKFFSNYEIIFKVYKPVVELLFCNIIFGNKVSINR